MHLWLISLKALFTSHGIPEQDYATSMHHMNVSFVHTVCKPAEWERLSGPPLSLREASEWTQGKNETDQYLTWGADFSLIPANLGSEYYYFVFVQRLIFPNPSSVAPAVARRVDTPLPRAKVCPHEFIFRFAKLCLINFSRHGLKHNILVHCFTEGKKVHAQQTKMHSPPLPQISTRNT